MAKSEIPQRIDPFLMSVLASRFEAIIREMTNTVMKASRSAVIKNARDMSCGLLTFDHRLISVEEGIPIHITALDLTTRPITEFFDDIEEGDAFLNNCPYTGTTHHADLTLCVPVFCDGEPLFWTLSRSHHADVGAPIPTTYLPYARTIYEEGVHFPCVRIQRKFEDLHDIVRIGLMKIRVNNVWYGDYRAQVGACRIGERRLKELVERYGKDTIKTFVEEWIEYGKRRAIAAIRQFPKGSWTYETRHDPVPTVADEGVSVRVTVTVDPDEGKITVDARDNVDCVPGGINLSEATSTGSCRIGVFYNLDSTIPHNEGSASRIEVLIRDGCVVGRPRYPVGTSVATTNINDRLVAAVASCFAQMGRPFGMAEGGYMQPIGMAVISGVDSRKDNQPYVNQMFIGYAAGPGLHGYDGWITFCGADNGGMIVLDSVEIDESMYPIIVEGRWLEPDTLGAGEYDGAPGTRLIFRPIADDMNVIYCSDGEAEPGQGRARRLGRGASAELQALGQWRGQAPARLPSRGLQARRSGDQHHRCRRRLRRSTGPRSRGGGGHGQSRLADAETRRGGLRRSARPCQEWRRLRGRRAANQELRGEAGA